MYLHSWLEHSQCLVVFQLTTTGTVISFIIDSSTKLEEPYDNINSNIDRNTIWKGVSVGRRCGRAVSDTANSKDQPRPEPEIRFRERQREYRAIVCLAE